MEQEKTIIQGILDRIVFSNEKGFLIGSFKVSGLPIPIKDLGTILAPQVDIEYKLTGHWETDVKFGKQLRIERHEAILPQDKGGIFKYLVRMCKYVGVATGNDLINKYGTDTLNIMKIDPGRIALEIKGITLEKAEEIQKGLLENEENERIQVELEALLDVPGMRKSLISDLMEEYKGNSAEKVRQNPYFLTEFHGIGFTLADKVALLRVGIERDHIERKKAAAYFAIREHMRDGHVWIRGTDLLMRISALIQVSHPEEGIEALIGNGTVDFRDGSLATAKAAADEKKIADFIAGGVRVSFAV
jgi:ATP-dependent exoDNAse (exonuclease V) alpha subunit